MAVNKAFHTSNSTAITSEKNLYSDLVKEAIQIFGHDVYYIDRTTVAIDSVLTFIPGFIILIGMERLLVNFTFVSPTKQTLP